MFILNESDKSLPKVAYMFHSGLHAAQPLSTTLSEGPMSPYTLLLPGSVQT